MWIEIKDQLPDEGQDIIYYFDICGVNRGKFTQQPCAVELYGESDNKVPYAENCFYGAKGWLTDDVTHWMPDDGRELPEAPSL